MRKYPDGRSAEAVSFRALNQLNLKTSRAWCIKENFSQFWSYSYKGAAKRFFKAWSNNAMRSQLEPVKKVVKMLRRHEEGLLNYSQHGISNACAEGFNSAIQLIKANARGFRNFVNYRARILIWMPPGDQAIFALCVKKSAAKLYPALFVGLLGCPGWPTGPDAYPPASPSSV